MFQSLYGLKNKSLKINYKNIALYYSLKSAIFFCHKVFLGHNLKIKDN